MNEEWRDIPDFEDKYQVSNMGRVRSKNPRRRHINPSGILKLVVFRTNRGSAYHQVTLYDGRGNSKSYLVHILVLCVFVGEPPEGTETRHLNGNSFDNKLSNLTYGTPKQNAEDKKRHGTHVYGESHPQAKLTWEQVKEIRDFYTPFHPYYGARAFAKRFGVNENHIRLIVLRKRWAKEEGQNEKS